MFRIAYLGAALCVAAVSMPVAAATVLTFDFGRASGAANLASVSATSAFTTLTATALRFTAVPDTLTNLSQTTTTGVQIRQTTPGIGVNGGASADQLDTNMTSAREGILFTGSQSFGLRGLKLSFIDADDTLQIYGVNADNTLVALGYGGVVKTGLGAGETSSTTFSAINSGTVSLIFTDPTARFNRFLFTTRIGGDALFMGTRGQGYRIDAVTAEVPEPATWAMLIAGFGLVGTAARRRRAGVATA